MVADSLDPQTAQSPTSTPALPEGFVLQGGIPVRKKTLEAPAAATPPVPPGFVLKGGIPVKDTRPRIGAGPALPAEGDLRTGYAAKPYNLTGTALDVRDPSANAPHVLRTAAEGIGMMLGGEGGGYLATRAAEGAMETGSIISRGISAVSRLATRVLGASGGAAVGHVVGGTIEQASPNAEGPPPSVESTAHAAEVGGAIEAASGPVSAVAGGVGRAVGAAHKAYVEGAPIIPAVSQSVKETLAPIARTTRAGLNTLFGPPKVYGAEDIAGHAVPPVNVGKAMGATGTAGQVRGSSTLTGVERVVRGSLGGGGPLDTAIDAGEQKLHADTRQIISRFGVPVPTTREAGDILLTPPRVEAQQASEGTAAQLTELHTAIIRQADAHAQAAQATEEAQRAVTAGAMDHAAALRQQAETALKTAQEWDAKAATLRQQVYGTAGPIRTEEESSQILHALNTQAETRADDAVDELYREVDSQGAALGAKGVSLQEMLDTALAAGKVSSALEKRLNPPGAGLPGRVAAGSQVPAEEAVGAEVSAAQILETRGRTPGGQPKEIPQEAHDALMQAFSDAGVGEEELTADQVSFTQARRIRSALGRIAYRARSTNPTLAHWAGVFKDTIGQTMKDAAEAAGSDVWTTYRAADQLFHQTQQIYKEGILDDLANTEPHMAVRFLAKRSGKDLREILSGAHLGQPAQQALRGALVDQVFKDPTTGAWRTGKSLATELKKWSPEQLDAIFGAASTSAIRTTPEMLRGAERATAEGRRLLGTPTQGGAIRKAEGQALTEATGAMKAEQATIGVRAKAAQAREDYLAALQKNSQATEDTLNAMNPETALATTITKTTDVKKLTETREKVLQLLGPEAWASVQARWVADLLDLRQKDTLLKRVTSYPPDVVRLMIPDAISRNRVYQLGRVFEHLAKSTPAPRYYGMATQALGAISDIIAFHNLGGAAERALVGTAGANTLARILANDQAGAAFVSAMKAGATDPKIGARLFTPVVAFLQREGLLTGGQPRTIGAPPPTTQPTAPAGRGPGSATAGGG